MDPDKGAAWSQFEHGSCVRDGVSEFFQPTSRWETLRVRKYCKTLSDRRAQQEPAAERRMWLQGARALLAEMGGSKAY
eukprot:2808040-Rhodomonas_salina.1